MEGVRLDGKRDGADLHRVSKSISVEGKGKWDSEDDYALSNTCAHTLPYLAMLSFLE